MVPPWNSCGCNFPSRALAANSLIALLISMSPLRSACGTIGVINPLSVATATEHSTESYLNIWNICAQLICHFYCSHNISFWHSKILLSNETAVP